MTPITTTPAPAPRSTTGTWIAAIVAVALIFTGPRLYRAVAARYAPAAPARPGLPTVVQQEQHSIDVVQSGGRTTLLSPGATVSVRRRDAITFAGWAVDTSAKAPSSSVELSVGGLRYATAVSGDRPDVAQALGADAYRRSGFRLSIPANALPPGRYAVAFAATDADGSARYDLHYPLTLSVAP